MPQEEFPQLQVSKVIMKGQISWRNEFIHPTQMLCFIIQNYDISINQNPGFVC